MIDRSAILLVIGCQVALGATLPAWAADAVPPAAATASPPGAAGAPPPGAATGDTGSDEAAMDIDIVARRLDEARQRIQPSLGASVTGFTPEALATIPQGGDAPLNQVLLHAPGVAEDSFGQIHLRGEHANVQYRLNGVELPEGLSVFGQAIESHFAERLSLITGALPAQYGLQTAGVVDIQTKNGTTNPGGSISLQTGSWNWLQPTFEYGGRTGATDWFVTGDYLHNDRGIENPTAHFGALHDTTDQFHGMAYVSTIIDPDTRISFLYGGFSGRFQIPNNPGQPTLGFAVNGVSSFNSAQLNENQQERTDFADVSLQKHMGDVDMQISAYTRVSRLSFSPDTLGDLLFNGISQQATRSNTAYGLQADNSWRINDDHTLRFGFIVQQATTSANTLSQVLPVDASGTPTTDIPMSISDNFSKTGGLYGVYVQDEWRLLQSLTLNAGLRFDAVDEFTHENQVSPRINLVWQPTSATTLHAGYARYFVPPPFELVSPGTLSKFVGTTGAPFSTQNDSVRAERSHYFDVGVSRVMAPGLTLGVDAYYKISRNLLDEGQFGAPVILTAFNYDHGTQQGVEWTGSYDRGPWSVYGNLAWSRAMGKKITSAQFNFGPDELAFISANDIHLDHDQTWTGSAGVAYTLDHGEGQSTRLSLDAVVQSGLRASTATVPNGIALPTYGVVNASVTHKMQPGIELRLDVLNVADSTYQIRNGTGVGVGAPQYGLRRTILTTVTKRF
jgi:outer membrane receptor protein involved in Fe transport